MSLQYKKVNITNVIENTTVHWCSVHLYTLQQIMYFGWVLLLIPMPIFMSSHKTTHGRRANHRLHNGRVQIKIRDFFGKFKNNLKTGNRIESKGDQPNFFFPFHLKNKDRFSSLPLLNYLENFEPNSFIIASTSSICSGFNKFFILGIKLMRYS